MQPASTSRFNADGNSAKTPRPRKRQRICVTGRLCLSQTYWLAVDRESGDADL
jgi:hypothetical protein